jgi:diaminohydroxyphosphoribosylaminopyrimidine deaminase/5-amino-6-(5-phosphoribosylamino)uracil reductase
VLVIVGPDADGDRLRRLIGAGCEVEVSPGDDPAARLEHALLALGRRTLTNVLVEGGSTLFGALFDAGRIDEVWAFVAPKVIGGAEAIGVVGGEGVSEMHASTMIDVEETSFHGGDILVRGLCRHAV